jgi:hypothetical protein
MTPDDRPLGRTTDQTQEHPEHVSEHPKGPQILISDRQTGLPYSKGLMASQVMVTGLSPYRSYQVAEAVEERLLERGLPSVTWRKLSELTRDVIEESASGSEEVSASSEETTSTAEQVASMAAELAKIADELKAEVGKLKVE